MSHDHCTHEPTIAPQDLQKNKPVNSGGGGAGLSPTIAEELLDVDSC